MDLDHFPTSESAKLMMSYITQSWYDRSYVAKWLFQVMGVEYDDSTKLCEELIDQAFPETATWGMKYQEIKYGLPVQENLPLEERRRRVINHRDDRAPITPWKMEQILQNALSCTAKVIDINEDPSIEHPNLFRVEITDTGSGIDIKKAFDRLRQIKQSHTTFCLCDVTDVTVRVIVGSSEFGAEIPLTGTLPDTATGLALTREQLQLMVATREHAPVIPRSGEAETGVHPITSTGLLLDGSDIKLLTAIKDHRAVVPVSGEKETGIHPETNTALLIDGESIQLTMSVKDHGAVIPMPGNKNTGEYPDTSTVLTASPGGMSFNVSDTSFATDLPVCGDEDIDV